MPVVVPRGWTAVDATWHGITIRFANTHLEAFHPTFNGLQAQELTEVFAAETKPLVLVGDINAWRSAEPAGVRDPCTSRRRGRLDAGEPRQRRVPCCFPNDLSQATEVPSYRIDVVLFRQPTDGSTPASHFSAALFGVEPGERVWCSQAGALLWPSDHAGVRATLQYRGSR